MPGDDEDRPTCPITPRLLRELAGDTFFQRGEAYFERGAVRSLSHEGDGVKATVQGTHSYRVRLWLEDDALCHDCSCPMGGQGYFCKHCVAVGLAWEADGGTCAGPDTKASPAATAQNMRDHLMGLEKEALVAMLLDLAADDERLHRRLTVQAAQGGPAGLDMTAWRGAFDSALATDQMVSYGEAYGYAAGIGEVVDALDHILREGHAERVIELAEYGLKELEQAIGYVDDSDGWMGGLLHRLQQLHLDACLRARPDPVELAEQLFEFEMMSDYDVFHEAAAIYADVLGDTGVAAYNRLAEAKWAKVTALGPGEEDPDRDGRRFRITDMMAALAQAAGDLDALVAVKSRDLSKPHDFLQIAALLQDAGDRDAALDWAERGLQAFPDDYKVSRLRAFAASAYQDRNRHDEAMALIWRTFTESPWLETYCELETHARRAEQWPAWRDKALDLIRKRLAAKAADRSGRADPRSWMDRSGQDHSSLVHIFLHEGDVDAAWHEAETGGCSEHLWLELAKRRETSHPAEAARVYTDHVAALLRNTGNDVYEKAVRALEKVETLQARCGRDAAFQSLLAEIRDTHRRKRNLMKLLDAKGW